ncbi:hypothetical protein ABMA27_007717 [Loxostege sticticalis]|uniref:Uncharacterized protein n=1 Tax=Loxostege sticticalis TaxID=481309 RepID=A0ABR3HCZ5_LOXSC
MGTSYGEEKDKSKALDPNATILPRNGFRFEEHTTFSEQTDINHIKFEDEADLPLKFEETPYSDQRENSGPVTFQDDNKIEDTGHKKRKRRRRRKPRYQNPGQYPVAPGQGFYPGYPGQPLPGQALYATPGQGYPDGGPGFGPGGDRPAGQFYRPPRRPKQSFASEALSAVTGALTSIALYDDYQCVPRLLCEAAGGGALGTSSVLQSVAGLQPLLTLLSAYSGISSSPLFVFGRAVFLGMTSKGNTASCRYAYPQCPTDPEQLVHYLNNHNGGFFRFFNAPQQQIPQNLEQFYNQLSGYGFAQPNQQNYGLYNPQNPGQQFNNPQINQNPQNPQQFGSQAPQNYQNGQYGFYTPQNNQNPQQSGLYNPQLNYPNPGQHFGPQDPPQNPQQFGYYQPSPGQKNYGFYNPPYNQAPLPGPYGLYNQFSGPQNPYASEFGYRYHKKRKPYKGKYGFGNVNYKDSGAEGNKIEKRIQNKPYYVYIDSNTVNEDESSFNNFKWIFPEDYNKKGSETNNNVRGGKNLKFPDENTTGNIVVGNSNKRKAKSIVFPESQGIKYVNYYEYPPVNNEDSNINYQNYNVGHTIAATNYNNFGHFTISNSNQNLNSNAFIGDDEIQTVYIVRDDPNNPEIVKTRRGQRIQ